jgi:hypothetical protein
MKFTPADNRNAVSVRRLTLALAVAALLPILLYGSAPSWWSQRGVLIENATADDYAPVNQGQLKNIAKAAVAEMDAKLSGGAGDELHTLMESWASSNPATNDFAPVNIGQVKKIAKPFYDRLIAIKYVDRYPWTGAARLPQDFAVANIGQLKNLFSFDFTSTDPARDTDQNGLPDWWEKYYFGHIGVDSNAAAPRGDGLTTLQSFQQGLDPIRRSPQFLTIKPDRIEQALVTGQVMTKAVTITNGGSVPREVDLVAHNNTAVQLSYTDSDQPDGPQFVWDDISATGLHLAGVSDADDDFEAVPLSFAFPYFGNDHATVYVSSNGFVTLGPGSSSYLTYFLPSPAAPANLIAAFENDLDLSASGDIYFQDFGDRAVIQFQNAARIEGDGFSTFQIVLRNDGTIQFYYKDMSGTLNGATVGIQNSTRDKGLTIAYRQPYLKSNFAVQITQFTAWFQASPTSAVLQPGATETFTVTLDSRVLTPGVFRGGVFVTTDNPFDAPFDLRVITTVLDESQLDDDNDTISNAQERALGTNPAHADTDGDGMPDAWEVTHNLNPLSNDASADVDSDGFTNLQEYQNFTDPLNHTAPVSLIDKFDDWSQISFDSGNWQLDKTNPENFDGDTSRAIRTSETTASLDYWMPGLMSVDAIVYYQGSLRTDQVRFYASLDSVTWTEVSVARIAGWPAGGALFLVGTALSRPIAFTSGSRFREGMTRRAHNSPSWPLSIMI